MDFSQLLTATISWWDVLFAVIAIVLGWVASGFAKRGVTRLLARLNGVSPATSRVAAGFAQYAVLFLGVGIALAILGANIQPLIAIVIIVTVVVALVLRGVADNFASGVLIQTRHPVVIGDRIEVEGPDGSPLIGTITELNSRAVIFVTADGRTAHVPNALLMGSVIVNHTQTGALRTDADVSVERTDGRPVDDTIALLRDAAASVDGVSHDDPPAVLPLSISPERIVARVQFWHAVDDGVAVTSRVVSAVAAAVERTGGRVWVVGGALPPPLLPPVALGVVPPAPPAAPPT